MGMKKKKTKKVLQSNTPEEYPAYQASLPHPLSSQKSSPAGSATVSKSVGALLSRVRSYFIPAKPAEA